jgi:hypothetical protein
MTSADRDPHSAPSSVPHTELMSQEEVLDFKSVRRLEQVGDKRSNQSQDHAHRIGSCADSAEPRH